MNRASVGLDGAREKDHWDHGRATLRLQAPADGGAIAARQLHVQQDQVGLSRGGDAQSVLAVEGDREIEVTVARIGAQEAHRGGLVADDQEARAGLGQGWAAVRRLYPGHCDRRSSGMGARG